MFSKVAVDVKDVTSVVDVTMKDTVLSAMVELDVTWTLPTLIHIQLNQKNSLLVSHPYHSKHCLNFHYTLFSLQFLSDLRQFLQMKIAGNQKGKY